MASRLTPTSRVVGNVYLVEEITSYCDQPSLAACLRLNRMFFAEAGKHLYRVPPVIDDRNMRSFFLGAPLTEDYPEPTCNLADEGPEHLNPMQQAELSTGVEGVWEEYFNEGRDDPEEVARRKRYLRKMAFSRDTLLPAPLVAVPGGSDASTPLLPPNFLAKPCSSVDFAYPVGPQSHPASNGAAGTHQAHRSSPTPSNFKLALLRHVQVFSVGTHHHCYCEYYGPWIEAFMGNVHTLQIVPGVKNDDELHQLCDNGLNCPCEFYSALRYKKLVIRNLDGRGFPVPEDMPADRWKPSPDLEETVFFVPSSTARTEPVTVEEEGPMFIWNIGEYSQTSPKVKIVFAGDWEEVVPREQKSGRVPVTSYASFPNAVCQLGFWTFYGPQPRRFEVVGLEEVMWVPIGDEFVEELHRQEPFEGGLQDIGRFSRYPPGMFADQQDRIVRMVEDELCTWERILKDEDAESRATYLAERQSKPVFFTYEQYLENKAGRNGEIEAAD